MQHKRYYHDDDDNNNNSNDNNNNNNDINSNNNNNVTYNNSKNQVYNKKHIMHMHTCLKDIPVSLPFLVPRPECTGRGARGRHDAAGNVHPG